MEELNKQVVECRGNTDDKKVDSLQCLNVNIASVDHVDVDSFTGSDMGRGLVEVDTQSVGVKSKSLGVVGNSLHGGGGIGVELCSDIGVCNACGSAVDLMGVLDGGDVNVGHGDGRNGEEVRQGEASVDGVGGSGNASVQQVGEEVRGEKTGCDLFDVEVVCADTLKCGGGGGGVLGGGRLSFLGVDHAVGHSMDGLYDVSVRLVDCDDIGPICNLENWIEEADKHGPAIQYEEVGLTVSNQVAPTHAGDVNMEFPVLMPECCVSDLVWGKVRSHPWWPGQKFDSSAASAKARKCYKRDCYLIAYFGDKTFAWNDVTEIKPFWENFVLLDNQSDSFSFRHAVDCALAEISRRLQSGLACHCIPEHVYSAIKTQKIDNSGICIISDQWDGQENFPAVASFEPSQLIRYMTTLAKSPKHEVDKLQCAIAQAQVMAFFRWYCSLQFPQLQRSERLTESDALLGDSDAQDVKLRKRVLPTSDNLSDHNGTSHKRKKCSQDDIGSRRKVKSLSVLMADSCFNVPDIKLASVISKKPCKGSTLINSETEGNGKRVKSILGISPSVPKETDESASKMLMVEEGSTFQEMLSQLHLAARDPFRGYNLLIPTSNFYMDFRKSNCLEYMGSPDHEIEKLSGEPELDSELECRDSYWTDRIIQRIPEVQLPFGQSIALDTDEVKEDATFANMGRPCSEEYVAPTALILRFTDISSIPSEAFLNEVFSSFGPIYKSQTEVQRRSRSAKVVFSRRADAEKAFSSAGKYRIFGPSLRSYSLEYMSSRKSIAGGTKHE